VLSVACCTAGRFFPEVLSRIELRSVERAVGMRLKVVHDDHETRCVLSLGEFRALRR